jgi:hypothetical protein
MTPSPRAGLDWPNILKVCLTQFVPWLASVLLVTWAGYPGVVCVTPMAWLIALRVGLVCVNRSASPQPGQRLSEAALAGALLGLLQGTLFWIIVPLMGPIKPAERANAIGLGIVIAVAGMAAGALLSLFTAYMVERRQRLA